MTPRRCWRIHKQLPDPQANRARPPVRPLRGARPAGCCIFPTQLIWCLIAPTRYWTDTVHPGEPGPCSDQTSRSADRGSVELLTRPDGVLPIRRESAAGASPTPAEPAGTWMIERGATELRRQSRRHALRSRPQATYVELIERDGSHSCRREMRPANGARSDEWRSCCAVAAVATTRRYRNASTSSTTNGRRAAITPVLPGTSWACVFGARCRVRSRRTPSVATKLHRLPLVGLDDAGHLRLARRASTWAGDCSPPSSVEAAG